ncbi:hypothetical protein [Ammoniphilus sp. 3BR4]|uniref:hypothetical protein n=1 Tax=Ammoniphilus sp. 3BR4 TaxID=3158265 RepID=UPI0034655739
MNKDGDWQRLKENDCEHGIAVNHWYYEINDVGFKYDRVHYMLLTMHPIFSKNVNETPVAYGIWKEFVKLPLYPSKLIL